MAGQDLTETRPGLGRDWIESGLANTLRVHGLDLTETGLRSALHGLGQGCTGPGLDWTGLDRNWIGLGLAWIARNILFM